MRIIPKILLLYFITILGFILTPIFHVLKAIGLIKSKNESIYTDFRSIKERGHCSSCSSMRAKAFSSQLNFDRLQQKLLSNFNFIGSIESHSSKPEIEIMYFKFGSKSFTGADLYKCKACNLEW
tara:strand:+ start:20 stop:391 length:372 start_codon:yes stop_codon:yes gene_type:complete